MSHTNQINETQPDNYKCIASDFVSANEIASGKIYQRAFV